jgi:hypothetical protein
MLQQEIRREPVQPRKRRLVNRLESMPLLEGQAEDLPGEIVGDVASGAAVEVAMDRIEVAVEQDREEGRLASRVCDQRRIRACIHRAFHSRRGFLSSRASRR